MIRIRSALLGATIALVMGGCATAGAPSTTAPQPAMPETRSAPAATVDSLMAAYDREDTPGAAVLVFRGDEQLFAKGYGRASLEHDAPITMRTVFHTASVSKQFTGFAIAMLAAQGRLSLDDDVRKHLPELPDFGERITLRHVLHHTSGLRDQWALWFLAGGTPDDAVRHQDILRLIHRQRELNFAPGTEHLYSNTGYTLLAEVVKRVTGEDFGRWMKANVFEPLGMRETQVYDDHSRVLPGRADSYRAGNAGFQRSVLTVASSGATGIYSTPEDLARWLRNFGSAAVGGQDVMRMMRTRGVVNGDTSPYAMGVLVAKHRGLDVLQHSGADAGFRAAVSYYPALDAGVVVLANAGTIDPDETADRIAEAFFAAEMAPAPPVVQAAPEPAPVPSNIPVDSAVLDRYAGHWEWEGMPNMRLERDGHSLVMVAGPRRIPMPSVNDSTFMMGEDDIVIVFHHDADGTVSRATLRGGGHSEPARRTHPYTPSAADLRAYTGRYYSPELETVYTLVLHDGRLVARHRRHGDVPLTARRENAFRGAASWMEGMAFERGAGGAVTGMRITSGNGRIRNVWFEKLD